MTEAHRNVKVHFEDYRENSEISHHSQEPAVIDENASIEVAYDGGRLDITVNGTSVYSTKTAGDDFSFTLKNS